jgi:hypothetical protein
MSSHALVDQLGFDIGKRPWEDCPQKLMGILPNRFFVSPPVEPLHSACPVQNRPIELAHHKLGSVERSLLQFVRKPSFATMSHSECTYVSLCADKQSWRPLASSTG